MSKHDTEKDAARGWFADWDNDVSGECGWQPCMATGQGHIPCFQVWFRTKAECEEWIAENVIGVGWYAGEPTDTPDPRAAATGGGSDG